MDRGETITRPCPADPPPSAEQKAQLANHWLRIRVSDLATGKQRVAVNVPLSWCRGALLGARYAPEIAGLDPNELLTMLQSGANGPVVDVEDTDDGSTCRFLSISGPLLRALEE